MDLPICVIPEVFQNLLVTLFSFLKMYEFFFTKLTYKTLSTLSKALFKVRYSLPCKCAIVQLLAG